MGYSSSKVDAELKLANKSFLRANYLVQKGDYEGALALYRKIRDVRLKKQELIGAVEALSCMADMIVLIGEKSVAASLYMKVFHEQQDLIVSQPSKPHSQMKLLENYATTAHKVSELLRSKKCHLKATKEAESILFRAIALIEQYDGMRSLLLIPLLHSLAEFNVLVERFPLAELYYRRSIGIQSVRWVSADDIACTRRRIVEIGDMQIEQTRNIAAERIQGFFYMCWAVRRLAARRGKKVWYHKLRPILPEEAEEEAAGRIRTLKELGLSDWDPRSSMLETGEMDGLSTNSGPQPVQDANPPFVWTVSENDAYL
eukprot:PhF_6_TR28306/c0_g1_i1/m.41921